MSLDEVMDRSAADLVPNDLRSLLMPFTAKPRLQEAAAARGPRQGHATTHARGPRHPGRHRRLLVHQCRHNRGPHRRSHPAGGHRAGFRPHLPVRPPQRLHAGEPHRRAGAGDLDHVFFCKFRLGSRGHRAEDRPRLPERHGPGLAHPPHRRRARLSRRRLRRHQRRRHRAQPQGLRHVAGRRGITCPPP